MSYKVLIVEDDKQLKDLITFAFESHDDIEVFFATDEYTAMSVIDSLALDAVITDIQLNSHEGGLAVLKKASERELPIAIMTADITYPDQHFLDLGATWVIRKPFDTLELPIIAKRLASLND